jgi:phospholipase/lecithinase/hemolysin
VWGGANDFFMFPALAPSDVPGAVANAAKQVGSFVDTLYDNGARIFLVPNLPDLAKTPDSAGLSDTEKGMLTALTQGFNGALDAQLAARSSKPGITLINFDTFAGFNDILDDPTSYGLTNVTDSCLASGTLCNPSTFLFWDNVHPTERGHQIIAEQFYTRIEAAIPEPETYALVAAGLLLVSWQARRRTVN